jgi:hypothetical protein
MDSFINVDIAAMPAEDAVSEAAADSLAVAILGTLPDEEVDAKLTGQACAAPAIHR